MWNWAKQMQLKREELRNVFLSKDDFNDTAWHKAAENGHLEMLEKLCDWAKELQLKAGDLRNEFFFVKILVWTNSLAQISRKWQR
jgi:hypothetical protein